jgi:hypothetical protein
MPEILTILLYILGAFAAAVVLAYVLLMLSEGGDSEGPES